MTTDLFAPGHGDRRLCGRQKRQGEPGDLCTQAAGWGTSHPGWGACKLHSGSTQSGTAAAERERAEWLLEDARQTYGMPLDVDPADALLALVHTAAGAVAWLGRRVAELEQGKVTTVDGKTHPLVALYLEERKELAKVSKSALDAGIAERMVRLSERQGAALVALLEGFARALGLDPAAPEVRAAAHQSLLQLEGGTA